MILEIMYSRVSVRVMLRWMSAHEHRQVRAGSEADSGNMIEGSCSLLRCLHRFLQDKLIRVG